MNYEELKKLVLEKLKVYPKYKERAIQELMRAKIAYDNDVNLVDELTNLKSNNNLSDGYILPFFLSLAEEPTEIKPIELKQVKAGGGGGLDIDSDISTAGKPKLKSYLEKKYGKEHIVSVGTYAAIGKASAIKDILRKEGVAFALSNKFCSELKDENSFEEDMENYKHNFPDLYRFYETYKPLLDFVPRISNMYRSIGKHAGGVMVLDKPVYECVPVVRVHRPTSEQKEGETKYELATAFTESGSAPELDDLGFVKYDLLAISQLDTIDNALNMAEKDGFFKIEDDDGIIKIVSKAYLLEKGLTKEEIDSIGENV